MDAHTIVWVLFLLAIPAVTWLLASRAYGSKKRGAWLAGLSMLGCLAGVILWVIPGTFIVGGHFRGAWYFLLLPPALVGGWVVGLLLPIAIFRRRGAAQAQHNPTDGSDAAGDSDGREE